MAWPTAPISAQGSEGSGSWLDWLRSVKDDAVEYAETVKDIRDAVEKATGKKPSKEDVARATAPPAKKGDGDGKILGMDKKTVALLGVGAAVLVVVLMARRR